MKLQVLFTFIILCHLNVMAQENGEYNTSIIYDHVYNYIQHDSKGLHFLQQIWKYKKFCP